jgi:hypothetical protein
MRRIASVAFVTSLLLVIRWIRGGPALNDVVGAILASIDRPIPPPARQASR